MKKVGFQSLLHVWVLFGNLHGLKNTILFMETFEGSGSGFTPEPTFSTTTERKQSCSENPCGTRIATCINLIDNTYVCQCPINYYYNTPSKSCDIGDSFYGNLDLKFQYTEQLNNHQSEEFKDLHKKVNQIFQECFKDEKLYKETRITEVLPSQQLVRAQKVNNFVQIKVINLFVENSNLSPSDVNENVAGFLETNYPGETVFSISDVCDGFYCDDYTTVCINDTLIPDCVCKDGFDKIPSLDSACPVCDSSCNRVANKECVQVKKDRKVVPECLCLHDYYMDNSGVCVPCQFGYSGKDCKNNYLLILTTVTSVLGILIFGFIIGGIVFYLRKKRKPDQEDSMLLGTEGPNLFPRVQVQFGNEDRTSSVARDQLYPYEMDEQYTRQSPRPHNMGTTFFSDRTSKNNNKKEIRL
ncbi:mucin-13 [Discoglossus pictus]